MSKARGNLPTLSQHFNISYHHINFVYYSVIFTTELDTEVLQSQIKKFQSSRYLFYIFNIPLITFILTIK